MQKEPPKDAKAFIQWAVGELGVDVDALGSRIGYPSLRRAMYGEFSLPEARRVHIQDLVLLRRVYGPKIVAAGESRDMHPPHVLPEAQEEPGRYREPECGEKHLARAIQILTELYEKNPEAFRAAAAMLRGLAGGQGGK